MTNLSLITRIPHTSKLLIIMIDFFRYSFINFSIVLYYAKPLGRWLNRRTFLLQLGSDRLPERGMTSTDDSASHIRIKKNRNECFLNHSNITLKAEDSIIYIDKVCNYVNVHQCYLPNKMRKSCRNIDAR